ncbi:hypothetical protein [Olsenella sp. An270]|uniref:hypothetical protein n=1 Tax=Olsenella sp. An270 TaxID=1965615 RepID=UPI000B397235|nr:hypothetical protein [Olsenella sp. An270]OUO58319.1 hypothetical protein B5F73_08665 [Olsenella sp. An270]
MADLTVGKESGDYRFFYGVKKDDRLPSLLNLFNNLEDEGMLTRSVRDFSSLDDLRNKGGQACAFVIELVERLFESAAMNEHNVLTIVRERLHIDASYRDSYYTYFSQQHFEVPRYSNRLTFFAGELSPDNWHDECERDDDPLRPYASCVINPLSQGAVGKTYIDPMVLLHDASVRVRVSDFKINVYGHPFHISAFPYRKQDVESNRCAEVTLLNLLGYYSNEYPDYARVEGSGIRRLEERYTYERNVPSKGISYLTFTRVLTDLGFYPRLYAAQSLPRGGSWSDSQDESFQRLMHYYVESGIPVAVNPAPSNTEDGHSLLCIGYKERLDPASALERADETRIVCDYVEEEGSGQPCDTDAHARRFTRQPFAVSLTDAADYYDEYVVIDDNQFPYTIRSSQALSIHPRMRNAFLVAPLSRRMALDAIDAREKFIAIVADPKNGVLNWGSKYLSELQENKGMNCIDVVMRQFLASSKHFRRERVRQVKEPFRRLIYSEIPMPHFVWVCELYERSEFVERRPDERRAFAEIVIDATSASNDSVTGSTILMNYPDFIGFRSPECRTNDFERAWPAPRDGAGVDPYLENLTAAGWTTN